MTTPRAMTATTARTLAAGALVLLLAGCGGAPTPAPSFGFGDDAVAIAQAVKACRAVASQPVPATAVGVTSVATCSISGSQVNFFVWKDMAAQTDSGFTSGSPERYLAHATGWDAVTQGSVSLGAQELVAKAIVGAVGGTVVHVR